MKDFNNNVLAIGDTVAFLEPNYRHMVAGKVIGFTAKMIRVEYSDIAYYARTRQVATITCLREPRYVAKIQQPGQL